MVATADSVIVELRARLDQYERDLRRAERRFEDTMRGIRGEGGRMERDITRNANAVGQQFRTLAGTIAAAFSAQQIAQYADGYTRFTNQLKVAGLEGENLAKVQGELFAIAQRGGVQLELLGRLYGGLASLQKDLNSTSADSLALTSAVSNSIKIQGTSAEQAAGGILGLNQALGSARVQTDEFNQIVDGLRPLLQAAVDGSDKYAGSINRLKVAIGEGDVSGRDLFVLLQGGFENLEAKAEKASLTIENSFTILNNALGKYIGETDESLSATERLSAGIITLSENIDTVANALAVLATVLVTRYAAGLAVAGARAVGLRVIALGLAVQLNGTAAAAALAGRALLGALGGPVAVAATALALGIAYLATETETAEERVARLAASANSAAAEADAMEARLRDAGVAMYQVDDASGRAAGGLAGVGKSAKAAERDLYDLEQQAIRTAVALVDAQLQENSRRRAEIGRADAERRAAARSAAGSRQASDRGDIVAKPGRTAREKEAAELDREFKELNRKRNAIIAGVRNGVDVTVGPAPRPAASGGGINRVPRRVSGASGGSGVAVNPAAAANRFADDLARGELALRQALADAVGTAAARRDVERESIRVEQAANARAIKADEDLTVAQREKLLALNDQIAAAKLAAIAAEGEREAIENGLLLRQSDLRNQQDALRLQAQLADTAKERRAIELRLLELQYEEERIRLQAIADNTALAAAEREAARRRLASLDEQEQIERRGVERSNESPLERRRRELNRSPAQLEEAAEEWVVSTLDDVQGRLRDAISKRIGVDDPILGGILDLFIEQVILRPLYNAFAEASNGGGLGGILGPVLSLFGGGRASGGHVVGGRVYRVNEGGGVEGFQPAGSGKIIPLGRMRSAMRGGGVVFQPTFNIDASGVNPDGFAEGIVRAVRKETAAMVRQGMQVVNQGVPGRVAQYERDGT